MYVISQGRKSAYIPVTVRDFAVDEEKPYSLYICSPDIACEVVQRGFLPQSFLQLAAFVPDTDTPFFVFCWADKTTLAHWLHLKDHSFYAVPVHCNEREYELLYGILHPGQPIDRQAIEAAMENDARYCGENGIAF